MTHKFFFQFAVSVEAIDNSETYWQGPTRVFEYESYRSTRIFEFHVPTLASKITFVFNEEKSDKECQDRGVQMYVSLQAWMFVTLYPRDCSKNAYEY